jgi:hypothetical protein
MYFCLPAMSFLSFEIIGMLLLSAGFGKNAGILLLYEHLYLYSILDVLKPDALNKSL